MPPLKQKSTSYELIAPSAHKLGASGGGFLASARKSIRSSLKGALSAKPPPLRILPASKPY